MISIRNDQKGWRMMSRKSDASVQVSSTRDIVPVTVVFPDGLTIRCCEDEPGKLISIETLKQIARTTLEKLCTLDI